ncbi:kinesin heavy chain [Basidiobolus meristosporus CBS 931.73]|uniref:Kinesin-like protein n=1 Tax=Basidiobolus meristosporus CBS 931.73 TaxID=1314790 RepID=A0A1Y1YIF6_9FUNG|nr:kinesin heavy chain [Basidiobolus meristosporus CBS 931.73]|eukprot:ORX97653.1 kinesin heavy chain [Basidiobolus meristosporus CBS 931.73]
MSGNNIKVVCRFRPQNKIEDKNNGVSIIDIDDSGTTVKLESKEYPGTFTFDRCFGPTTSQQELFEYGILQTVDDVMNGYNGTVFAYGQTGSGKTHTMMGDMESEEFKGIIPRIVETIFKSIHNSPSTIEYTVKVSYMEIYMEKIRDLLNPKNDNLPIHEEKNRGIYVKDLCEVYVSDLNEVYEVMNRGGSARVVSFTNMNAESSRSHSIFMIVINQKNLQDGSLKSGKLYLVDLAGSEKVGKTGASGQTLEEAKKINKSLTALGMVINALTDGKSTHIPYRDSKLTRILQESLGGNSRTTLIINCSPSSYNDAETLGTLRFGMRAKTIKNKAKVNQDLSPAELKAMLKQSKAEALTFKQYISLLEGELVIWRSGGTVPEEKYATMEKITGKNKGSAAAPTASSPTQPEQPALAAPPTPTASITPEPFGVDSRPMTPALVLQDDEREEFLKRENELSDQLTDKESELNNQIKLNETLKEEFSFLKEEAMQYAKENKDMIQKINELRLQMEKLTYENKDVTINMDSLKEANQELMEEVEELKKTITELRRMSKEAADEGKEKKKQEKMAQMMAELDPAISEKEQQIRRALSELDDIEGKSETFTNGEVKALRSDLSQAKTLMEQHEQTINELTHENDMLTRKRDELEVRLTTLEAEYEDLLDKTIAEEEAGSNLDISETVAELKNKLEAQYNAKREAQVQEVDDLRKEIERKNEDIQKLNRYVATACIAWLPHHSPLTSNFFTQSRSTTGGRDVSEKEKDIERIRKTMAQQLADFEVMKKSLMRDLQNRCEKVVELEISLDETREQYNTILRNNNIKAQQKKMAFLERNLEQLTNVQKQLVEQNTSLKKEVAIAERKLIARNERIQSLETLLQDAQLKLTSQQQKFEAQMQAVKERLEQARTAKVNTGMMGFNFGRIAKPLRGGGAPAPDQEDLSGGLPGNPAVEKLAAPSNKRSSWLASWRNAP